MFDGIFKGKIFLKRTEYVKPVQSLGEFQAEEQAEAVRIEKIPFEIFHGLNITSDQAVETERLGIREDLTHNMERWLPGRTAGEQILDERINQRLRSIVARELSLEQQQRGFIARKFTAGAGFLRNIRGFFRGEERDETGTALRDIFGENRDVEVVRINLAQRVLGGLNAAQIQAVQNDLAGRGLALPPPPPVPVGVNPQVFQLSLATHAQLDEMRRALNLVFPAAFPMPRQSPIFPTRDQIPPRTDLDRLIQLREVETEERKKLLSTTVYDPRRLSDFMDQVRRTHPDINNLINEILALNSLYPIENHPEAQALIAYFEYRWESRGPADLQTELTQIRENLPAITEKREEGKEPSNELKRLERVQELTKSIADAYRNLRSSYSKAVALGNALYAYNRRMYEHQNSPRVIRGADTVGAELQRSIAEAEKEKNKIQVDINNLEGTYRDSATELLDMIQQAGGIVAHVGGGTDPSANLRAFNAAGVPALADSDETQLFGATEYTHGTPRHGRANSAFQNQIQGFRPAQMEGMGNEIRVQYHKRFKKREQITPRQLLYLLKEGDITRQNITNPELRRRHALLSTNLMIADAGNMQLFRSGNLELAERLGGATLGSRRLNRLKKWVIAKFTSDRIYEARDIVNHVTGLDKDFAMFRGMPVDITLAEFRDLIERKGGISESKLFEFAAKLKEIFLSFEMLNSEGKVELYDKDAMDMERLIRMITLVREELRTRRFFEEIRGTTGDVATAALRKIREDEEAVKKDEKDLLGNVAGKFAEWKQLFSGKVLKNKFTDNCREARKKKKDMKMSEGEFESYLSGEGLSTAYEFLSTGLAAKEALDAGRKAAGWTWEKLTRGTGFTYDKGSRALGFAWRKALQPGGNYLIVKPVTWTARTAGKIAAFPFVLTGRVLGGAWKWAKKPFAAGTPAGIPALH